MNVCLPAINGFLSSHMQPNVDYSLDYFSDRQSIDCLNNQAAVNILAGFDTFLLQLPEE
jgi:hypothetical protein